MLGVVLDICMHRKIFEREKYSIYDVELNKLCVNDQYFFRFGCTHL